MSQQTVDRIKLGVLAGLAGGLAFVFLLTLFGGLEEVGRLVGDPSPFTSLLVHLSIAGAAGGAYGLLVVRPRGRTSGVVTGVLFGGLCYGIGNLTLMPMLDLVGRDVAQSWASAATAPELPSLIGHLLCGAILGAIYAHLSRLPATRGAGTRFPLMSRTALDPGDRR